MFKKKGMKNKQDGEIPEGKQEGDRQFWVYRAKCIGTFKGEAPPKKGYGKNPCGWHYFTSQEGLPIFAPGCGPDDSHVPCVQCGGTLVGLTLITEVLAKDGKEALRFVLTSRMRAGTAVVLEEVEDLLRQAKQKIAGLVDRNPFAGLGVTGEHDFLPVGDVSDASAFDVAGEDE